MIRSDFRKNYQRKFGNFHGQVRLKVLVAIAILVVSLVSSQLVFANNLAIDGQKLSQVGSQIKNLEAQNTTLKTEIAKVSSLTHLAQKAQEAGFVKPQKVIIY